MNTSAHPLFEYLKARSIKQTEFAKSVGISRTHLYRIMQGASTTTDTLKKISAATDGAVSCASLVGVSEDAA